VKTWAKKTSTLSKICSVPVQWKVGSFFLTNCHWCRCFYCASFISLKILHFGFSLLMTGLRPVLTSPCPPSQAGSSKSRQQRCAIPPSAAKRWRPSRLDWARTHLWGFCQVWKGVGTGPPDSADQDRGSQGKQQDILVKLSFKYCPARPEKKARRICPPT
jgi:hypothetical protein